MEGQWSEHFPAAAAEIPAAATPARYQRCLICPKCNARSCRLLKSSTDKNPGRLFYKCPALDHKLFFKWADAVKPHELIEVPYCGGCTAGVCRVKRVMIGPNKGRIMFMCRVKEGEGSCGYRVWQDELEMSEAGLAEEKMNMSQPRMENCNKTTGTVTDMVKDSTHRDEGTDTVSPLIEPSDDLLCCEVTSQMDHEVILEPHFLNEPETISRKMDQLKCLEDESNIISRRPHKRSRYGDTIASGFPISASFLTVRMALNSMSTRHCWMADAIRQNLSTELNGWWGRLAFHPMPCLMTCALKPSTSSVSYPLESTFLLQDISVNSSGSTARNSRGAESYRKLSFNLEQLHNPLDSTYVVQDKILVNSSDAATLARSRVLGAESNSKPFVAKGQRHSIMSNAFHQAAECLQNELLSRLEAMDAKDHEALSQAAEDTFAALDCLLFDHLDFKKRAKELIHCASSLVEIEQSMPTNDSYQKLVELCSSERVRLDEISCVHAEATEAVINNTKRLKVIQEEISSTMDWLLQIKAKVCCYEVKMTNLELELEEIARSKEVLEGKYLIASKELEESQKLFAQKEAEHNAAKAAFERARALLRG